MISLREKEHVAKSIDETALFAKVISEKIFSQEAGAFVLALHGELGAGKTAFTKELAKILGIQEERVTSPTFVIEKIYEISFKGFEKLIHIDAYRLERGEELLALGWKEITEDNKNLIVLEWPENVSGIIPKNALHIFIDHKEDGSRVFTIRK